MTTVAQSGTGSLLASLLNDESYRPTEPRSLEETGLASSLIESLICKFLSVAGTSAGRRIADNVCLPLGLLEEVFQTLRTRQFIAHTGAAQLNDYYYQLTDQGRELAKAAMDACSYVGPAPVPLEDYIVSVDAQTIRAEAPRRDQLEEAFSDICIEPELLQLLGPAINSGAGLFLYGEPGNGKTTLASRITKCFGQEIWVPQTIVEDGQLIKLFDAAYHVPVESSEKSLLKTEEHDRRWMKIRRPTVVVGGELTMDNLEIRHDTTSNVSEASLQMKSNCGSLLIDDFGRQRMEPQELLNRWIVPLESRIDFLTIATGKKIQVPFEQLIIFSTNLDPTDLTDEAFLRRIPYKVEVADPNEEEFHHLFEYCASSMNCEYDPGVVDYLINTHYYPNNRPLRRCQPRDLFNQIRNFCVYNELPIEMRIEYIDRVVKSYFTAVAGEN